MSTSKPRRLPIVTPDQEISGKHPVPFERAAKACKVGDPTHGAVLNAGIAMAERGINECIAPSSRRQYQTSLTLVRHWCRGNLPYRRVLDRRSELFRQAPETEKMVQTAMAAAFATRPDQEATALDPHANQVVQRYLGLCFHHAVAAVMLVLDGTKDPTLLLDIPGEVAGAIAYKRVALGAARGFQLRSAALSHATWEHQRVVGSAGHSEASLSVQLFHEYLGVQWKNHVDAQRLYLEEFLAWAFEATSRNEPRQSAPSSLATNSAGTLEPSP